ncbi:autotransporter outer membrane beta-barrel domain-containing protein [Lawsonia intracellularis]|nr:autotransporter outer membrane beta-barrel domain-containing protein [Lawsonia intracellularis]RBN33493.1 autotransporter outer membrane beta-barrel domain-containing protein [Lawsonia intracellularis]
MDLSHQYNIIHNIYEHTHNYLSLFPKKCKNYCIIILLCMCYILFNYEYSFSVKPTRQLSTNSDSSVEQQSEESSSSSEEEEGNPGSDSRNQFLLLWEQETSNVKEQVFPLQEESSSSKEFIDKAVQTGEDSSQSSSQSSESSTSSTSAALGTSEMFFLSESEEVQEVIITSSEEQMQQEVISNLKKKVKKLKEKLQQERKRHQQQMDKLKTCAVRQVQFLQSMVKMAQHQIQKVEIEKLEAQQVAALFQEALLGQEAQSQSSTSRSSVIISPPHGEENKSPCSPLSREDEGSDDSMPPLEGEEGDIWRDEYVSQEQRSQFFLQQQQQQSSSLSEVSQTCVVGSSRGLPTIQEEDEDGSSCSSIEGYLSSPTPSVLIAEEGSGSDLEESVKSPSEHPSGVDSDTLEEGEVIGEEVQGPLTTKRPAPSSSSDSSDDESLSPVVKRLKQSSSSPPKSPGSPSSRGDMSSMLIPGYNHESQYGSLKGLQCVLFGAVEQMSANLKTLVLKTSLYQAETKDKKTSSLIAKESKKACMSLCGKERSVKKVMSDSSNLLSFLNTCHFFGYTDSYLANQENKVSSGKVGLLMNPISNVSIGLTYNRHKNHGKEYHGAQLGTSFGSAKANMELDGFSAVVAWNSEEKGLTGYLSGCHNWGQMKNTRQVMQAGKEMRTKGSPDVQLSGVLGQLGYTFPLSKKVSCVPYIEATHIVVKWNQYREDSGSLPCVISGYTEKFQEKTIGLRTSMKITDKAILQTWVAGGTVQHTTSNITSMPLASPLLLYKTSVPGNKKKSFYSECGTLYEMNVTDFCKVDLHGSLRFKKDQKLDAGQMRLHFQYLF